MGRHMSRLIFRYILTDLFRLIGLTTLVLVTVIAFGATIKPLAGDRLLDVGQTFRYLALAIVPMLQYSLPFAAGFGATLAFQRMTAENEIQAMSASGISYGRILTPVMAFGVVLTLIMVLLTQWIIPKFWSSIEQMLETDVTKLLASSIRRHEPFLQGNLQIYADEILVQDKPVENGPDMRMVLFKVAAAELDDQKRIKTDVTANQAVVDVYRRDGRTYLKLAMRDTVVYESDTGTLAQSDRVAPPRPIVIPSVFRDKPKTMTQGQLLALRQNPDDFAQIIQAKLALAEAIHDAQARRVIDEQLHANARVEFASPIGQDETYIVVADRLKDARFEVNAGGPIEIIHAVQSTPRLKLRAKKARIEPVTAEVFASSASFNLALDDVEVIDLQQGDLPNRRPTLTLAGLRVNATISEGLEAMSSAQLIEHAQSIVEFRNRIIEPIELLQLKILKLNREIASHLLNRYALSVTAFLLVVLGSILAMVMRGSLPLAIFMWAFFPAIIDLILITAGAQLIRDGGILGHVLMWSGNGFILVMIGACYRKLIRN
jgi:lipopolysaccharide export LptBFGC system permease protein LptF